MKIPIYIIEEVLIRLQEINPEIGKLKTMERLGSQMIIKTSNGIITVPVLLLGLQLHDPSMLKNEDVEALAKQFIKQKGTKNGLAASCNRQKRDSTPS